MQKYFFFLLYINMPPVCVCDRQRLCLNTAIHILELPHSLNISSPGGNLVCCELIQCQISLAFP